MLCYFVEERNILFISCGLLDSKCDSLFGVFYFTMPSLDLIGTWISAIEMDFGNTLNELQQAIAKIASPLCSLL